MPTTRVRNVNGREQCAACIDGWVELRDRRGMAPCKWCEQGLARWQRHPELDGNFTGADIIPIGQRGPTFRPTAAFLLEREAVGDKREALMAMFPMRLWPSEWPRTAPEPAVAAMPGLGDDPAEVQRKVQAAEIARRQVEAEESAPQEPVSAVGAGDQIPQHGQIEPDQEPY